MNMTNWQMVSGIASIVSAIAIVAGSVFVIFQLRQAAKDRYFAISSDLFEHWQSPDFQEDQLFLLHKLPACTWDQFVANGRGERAERAFHRVGGFYDRVGHLVLTGLIRQTDILPTIGSDAIAVWQKVEPLVHEARRRENTLLFLNYEAVLPNCLECVVPAAVTIANEPQLEHTPLTALQPAETIVAPVDVVTLRGLVDRGEVQVLDVSREPQATCIKGAVRGDPNDLSGWTRAVAHDRPVVAYCT